jgi:hypothetical protein
MGVLPLDYRLAERSLRVGVDGGDDKHLKRVKASKRALIGISRGNESVIGVAS